MTASGWLYRQVVNKTLIAIWLDEKTYEVVLLTGEQRPVVFYQANTYAVAEMIAEKVAAGLLAGKTLNYEPQP